MNILCATDFSEAAMRAADVAAAIVKRTDDGSTVQLLHSAPDWLFSAEMPGAALLVERASGDLDREAVRLGTDGVSVTRDLRYGPPAEEIRLAAKASPPRLIIMGSTGAGMGRRWLIGKVAEGASNQVPVPALVVRNAEPLLEWLQSGRPLRVLCAVDFTLSADAAMAFVKQMLDWGPLHVEAAHVTRGSEGGGMGRGNDDPSQEAGGGLAASLQRDVWERLHDTLGDLPVEVYLRASASSPAATFLELASERRPDLIVVGSHQRHGLRRLSGPSFSRGVMVHSRTNVLRVPVASFHPGYSVPSMGSILVATDFSPAGNHAVLHASSLLSSGGRLRLLHICRNPTTGLNPLVASKVFFDHSLDAAKAKAQAETMLASLIPRQLPTSSIAFSTEVSFSDDAAGAIHQAAEKFGADMVCLGARGSEGPARILRGSTLQRLLSMTSKPLFVVHAPDE